MQSLEHELDITTQKIANLEEKIDSTRELLLQTIDSLKDTQRYLMKVAYNQAEITKRVSMWPYIAVPAEPEE
jgi:anion-transporting  ArsA/GET3 family ATPase